MCCGWVLRKISGPRRDEVRETWRRLHNEELHELFSLSDIIVVIRSRRLSEGGGSRGTHAVGRTGAHRRLVGSSEGKRLLGRPRRRRENNIKMGVEEVRGEIMDWIDLAQNRDRMGALVNAI